MGLTQRILLFTSALIVALLGTTIVFTTFQAESAARASLRQALTEARDVWEAYQADRFAKLKLGVRVLGNDSPFKAAVQTGDPQTVYDMLKERGRDLAADFFIATDANGMLVARSDRVNSKREDLSREPIVARALDGDESATVWRQQDRLYNAVAVPMQFQFGADLVGTLVAGYAMDDALARELGKLTHSDVAIVTNDAGEPRLSASSFGPKEAALRAVLPATSAVDGLTELDLRGERHAAMVVPLRSPAGGVLGRVVIARSLQDELAGYRRFRTSLIWVGAAIMGLALGLAVFAATRMTGPLRRLVDLVERARDGSYTGSVDAGRQDEIGHLARAFNRLLVDLREKEALIGFLRTGGTPPSRAPSSTSTTATFTAPTAPGTAFAGRYDILESVGRGSMGVVYRAHDRELDEVIALKVLRPEAIEDDPTLVERFKQETKLARKITHRNVLRTFDFGVTGETFYLTMEYLDGVTLKELIQRKGAIPLSVGLRIAKQICLGLEAAHAAGVVHRDIKPQNMLIAPESGELKITDFGIARVSEMDGRGMTVAGTVMGTPDYISPEQAQGQTADYRSDIYSLGTVLFEMFSGQLPFVSETAVGVILRHVRDAPPPLRTVSPGVPADLERIVSRCLEKLPGHRYERVGDILTELTELTAS